MVYRANSTLETLIWIISSIISDSKIKINGCSTRRAPALVVWLLKELLDNLYTSVSGELQGNPPSRSPLSEGWSQGPGWVFCCPLEESVVDSVQKNWGRLTSLCLHVSLQSHHPQMEWQFSASTDIQTCDCEVLQNYSSHTSFTWKPWQLQVGGSRVFFWAVLVCVGRRNKLYSLTWKGSIF